MTDLQDIADFMDATVEFFDTVSETVSPYLDWAKANWLTLVLTGEIIGAVVAIKTSNYRRGIGWLVAAILTIWAGAY